MLPVSTDTQWHMGYASVHLRKAWTVWGRHGNNNLMPSKNIYKHNCTQFKESVISHIDEGLATQCIISGCNRFVSRPRRKRKYPSVCLFAFTAWIGNSHARTQRHTRQPKPKFVPVVVVVLLWFPKLCDKSQHQRGDSLMTSFTLHFHPWSSFWLGL